MSVVGNALFATTVQFLKKYVQDFFRYRMENNRRRDFECLHILIISLLSLISVAILERSLLEHDQVSVVDNNWLQVLYGS